MIKKHNNHIFSNKNSIAAGELKGSSTDNMGSSEKINPLLNSWCKRRRK